MSVTANFFILFRTQTSKERVGAIEEIISNRLGVPAPSERPGDCEFDRFLVVDEPDLWTDVSDDGTLNYLTVARNSKLLGEPSLEHRLFQNSTLSRFWCDTYGDGPVIEHAITALVLLAQTDIEWVWLTSDYYEGKNKALTHAGAHQLIDDFIRVGDLKSGRPTRYIRTEAGVIDV